MTEKGTDLLESINQTLPLEIVNRFQELNEKRQAETLTEGEHAELTNISTAMEAQNVERIKHLSELALLLRTDLRGLMEELGLNSKNG